MKNCFFPLQKWSNSSFFVLVAVFLGGLLPPFRRARTQKKFKLFTNKLVRVNPKSKPAALEVVPLCWCQI